MKHKVNQENPENLAIRREIRWLVLPIIVESIFALSGNLIFIALLGRIDGVGLPSITHVAANGIATIITGIVWWLLKGIGVGATIRVAQAYGAGDKERLDLLALNAIVLQIAVGLTCSVLLFFAADFFVGFYKPEAELANLAVQYIRVCCFGFPFLAIMHSATGILQGVGDTKTPMKFSAILNVVFIAAGVPLIFGWFTEPLGVIGSAYALVLGQIITSLFGLFALLSKRGVITIHRYGFRYKPNIQLMRQVATVGLPTSLENIFWQFAAMIIGRLMLGYGELAYAANQIGLQAEAIANSPASSFGVVTVTLCGRAIGANNSSLGRNYLREIKRSSLFVVLIGFTLLVIFPIPLLRLLSNNEEVIELAAVYLRLMGLVLPLSTLSQIYMGTLKSAGMANIPMFVAMAGIWLIRVPLSYAAASIKNSNITWLWIVVLIDWVLRFFVTFLIFKKKQVFSNPEEPTEAQL